jgi:hypothetical protein
MAEHKIGVEVPWFALRTRTLYALAPGSAEHDSEGVRATHMHLLARLRGRADISALPARIPYLLK